MAALEQACKEIIETILYCLPSAFKGTVYRIGKPPDVVAERVTSGIIDPDKRTISWGLPEKSDYNPPGKPWSEYLDQPGRPLEAMAWCVEKQKSWTAEDPRTDSRSVRLQVEGVWEDFHHMEPVLIRKADLHFAPQSALSYPRDSEGKILWENSECAVVAVIKIHFRPYTIRIGSPETRIIKRLSRTLGTGLLSHELREQAIGALQQVAQDKLDSCNILADSLRNTLAKSGLIFSLIKLELGSLRSQWERELLKDSGAAQLKLQAVRSLNEILGNLPENSQGFKKELEAAQNKFLRLSLPPAVGENWVRMRIEQRWADLNLDRDLEGQVRQYIDNLKRSLSLGLDPDRIAAYQGIAESLKQQWVDLIYRDADRMDFAYLDEVIRLLENPSFTLPGSAKSLETLMRLKALAETMDSLEKNTNVVLREILNGNHEQLTAERLKPAP